jgi:very-short-patch-repair endonuclease
LPPFSKGGKGELYDHMLFYNTKLKRYSQELRKNMTDAERLLWAKLRKKQLRGCQFYRQRIIGNYIVDFYCPKRKIIIEVDGGQHYDEEEIEKDRIRDDYLIKHDLKVLRFSDRDILKNINGVVEKIFETL